MLTADRLDKPAWWGTVFQLRGSIALVILPRILLFSGLTATLALLQTLNQPLYLEKLGNLNSSVIYNLTLGLLIVFRTNTSYDRFWNGRKAWGELVINIRNLAREIQLGIREPMDSSAPNTEAAIADKQAALRLLSAFAIATKLHLRSEPNSDELTALLTPAQVQALEPAKNRPLIIGFWIRHYLQQQFAAGRLSDSLLSSSTLLLNNLTEGVSGCERIITTPIPIAYRVYLRRLIFIYCLTLPFRIVPDLGWWAIPIMAFVSFLLMGVEEVGRELENPFGYDVNDLPLDDLCQTIVRNVETTIALGQSLEPSPPA
ncbi:MAG: bestrophin family protein [Prochlorothrix sp.]|nr:bestrophin family ion channel [Prochlorothrix sp.]